MFANPPVVVERRTRHDLPGSRAGGMTPRTIEVLDQRGIADRFLSQGTTGQNGHYSGIFFDVSDLPTHHNYGLSLLQHRIERVLADWIAELGVPIYYGRKVTDFTQDDTGVTITVDDITLMRAAYLAGCDGGRTGTTVVVAASTREADWRQGGSRQTNTTGPLDTIDEHIGAAQ